MTQSPRIGTIPLRKQTESQAQRPRATPQRFPMRCILERARTEGQIHAGAADSCGVAALHGGDPGLGKIFWAKAVCSTAANEPAGANRSRQFWCCCLNSDCSTRLEGPRNSGRNGCGSAAKRPAKKRFAGTHDYHRKQSLSRGSCQPRCRGQELEAQEVPG